MAQCRPCSDCSSFFVGVPAVLQKKRRWKQKQKMLRGVFWVAALVCLGVLVQGLRMNRDTRYFGLMNTSVSRALAARGISNRAALSLVDSMHPPNLATARWILGSPIGEGFGPEWRRGLVGFLMKGIAAWGLAINLVISSGWGIIFHWRRRSLETLERRRREAHAWKLKVRSTRHLQQPVPKRVTLLMLLVDGA